MTKLEDLKESELDALFEWIDNVPLSRPKKNLARDFSDGVLVAEVIAFYSPKLVEIHNYPSASSFGQKKINWDTLNRKVLSKLKVKISDAAIQQIVDAKTGAIEIVLWDVRRKVLQYYPASANKKGVQLEPLEASTSAHAPPRPSSRQGESQKSKSTPGNRLNPVSVRKPIAGIGGGGKKVGGVTKSKGGAVAGGGGGGSADTYTNFVATARGLSLEAEEEEKESENIYNADGTPILVMYRGNKMIPAKFLRDIRKKLNKLFQHLKEQSSKMSDCEAIIATRDKKIEQMTYEILHAKKLVQKKNHGRPSSPPPAAEAEEAGAKESSSSTKAKTERSDSTSTVVQIVKPVVAPPTAPAPMVTATATTTSKPPRRVYEDV